jgi:hypothetical protein
MAGPDWNTEDTEKAGTLNQKFRVLPCVSVFQSFSAFQRTQHYALFCDRHGSRRIGAVSGRCALPV